MKKIAKLSLVAAVAVLGFTSANAQSLEEAIKNVETSGSVVYRYNDYNGQDGATIGQTSKDDKGSNNYKVGLNLSSKVNDDVKFNSRFVVGAPSQTGTGDAGFATLDSSDNGDQNVGVELTNANFAYTGLKNTTVTAGKQGLATPWTVALDSDGNEQTGTGILAMTTVGPVTLAGAYFNQTNLNNSAVDLNGSTDGNGLDGSDDIATVGAITTLGPVTADAWFLDMKDVFDSYTIGAKAAAELSGVKLGVDARWASLTFDGPNEEANTIAKIALTADAGLVDGKLAYATTDKDGGVTALDADANTTLLGWNLNALDKNDADYWQAVLGFDILSNLNLSANYGNLQYVNNSDEDMEDEEIYAQLLYKMSKNLTTYVRYGELTRENTTANTTQTDGTVGRLQVEYTF